MPLQRVHLAADAAFWPAAARAVLSFAATHGSAAPQLQRVTWLVPSGAHAGAARAALAAEIGTAFVPPRVMPLAAWIGAPADGGAAATLEVFTALRGSAWVRQAFGRQPAMLWSLARDIVRLADELTLAAADDAAFDERLNASLARHYGRRASRALEAPAALVLQLWRARRTAGDGASAWLAALHARIDALDTPLVHVGTTLHAGQDAGPAWEHAFLQRAAARRAVLHLVADGAAVVTARPLLVAAWPEVCAGAADRPIVQRAAAVPKAAPAPLALVCGTTLEDTASAVAQQTLRWLQSGCRAVALVPLDRLIARRVRALLERAGVLVADETGWKLSTTSAAAALMRWFDLVRDDLYWRDLLDWLKSSFTLAGRAEKAREIALIERAIRTRGAVEGVRALRRALAELAGDPAQPGALAIVDAIDAERTATLRAPATLAGQWSALRRALATLGLAQGLEADAVGRAVLAELDALQRETDGATTVTGDEFRALLAARMEETSYVDRGVESPVALVSLAATPLRAFDAVALIGADEAHLPAAATDLSFMNEAVRADLGLATSGAAALAQTAQLAVLVASTPQVMAAWRARIDGEPNALSPLLQRLQFVAAHAGLGQLARPATVSSFEVTPAGVPRPQPAAPDRLPPRLSASQLQSLVDCAYQFYARCLLGLQPPEDVVEMPDRRDYGIALHEVLKRFHRQWGGALFAEVQTGALAASLRAHARDVFTSGEREAGMLAFARRFDGLIEPYIDWLVARARAGWRWQASEVPQQREVALAGGARVELAGRIDRLDVGPDGQVALIDYKARAATRLREGLREAGEDIQLPFYGLLLGQPPTEALYLAFERAKADASGVAEVALRDLPRVMAEVDARLQADLGRVARGAPLPALGVARVCEYCEMRGLCRRDHWPPDEAAP